MKTLYQIISSASDKNNKLKIIFDDKISGKEIKKKNMDVHDHYFFTDSIGSPVQGSVKSE